ncbi:MAG: hypothetical protein ABIQ95_03440 [Bdellovibrionia bacterium]
MNPFYGLLKIVFLISICTYNVACQSGLVTVQTNKAGTKPYLKSPPAGEPSADRQGTAPFPIPNNDHTVYFVNVVATLNLVPSAIGLNFLSANAAVAYPFGIHLATPRPFNELSWTPVVAADKSRVSWIERPRNSGMPHLKVLEPSTLLVMDRGEVFNAINWSISSDTEWVAGVQADGRSLLQNMTSGVATPFFEKVLSQESRTLHLSSRKQVAILDPIAHRVDLFSLSEPSKVLKSWISNEFAASPIGSHFLIVDGHGVQIIEAESGKPILNLGEITNLRFPQWKNEEVLAFVSGPPHHTEIQILDLKTGQVNSVASLSAGPNEEILICPAWIKDDLFYADRTGEGNWSIWKVVDPISTSPTPKIFVQPHDSSKGYVCPKGVVE